jgi:signal transduction histidine kinase
MGSFYLFFQFNIIVVYFVYGLVFFMMGFAIALQNDKPSSLILARSFNYLAAFGIIHGLSEWGHVFIPIMETYSSNQTLAVLYFIETNLIGFSFFFLFYFGLKLCIDTLDLKEHLLWIPRIAVTLWFFIFILSPHLTGAADVNHWYLLGDITSRYAFALPGSLLSAYGILKQKDDLLSLEQPQIIRHLRWTAAMFVLYALFAGLIVPKATFFPANWLNIQNLFQLTGFPVAVYRAVICTVIAYFVIRLTAVFSYEYSQQLADAREEHAVLRERQRIRRDLHDGILQEIYAAGLSFESAQHIMATEPEKAREIISRETKHLDQINNEIRQYIMDIRQSSFHEQSLNAILLGMIEEFKVRRNIPVDIIIHDQKHEQLDVTQKENIYLIIQELLSNIIRHSRAKSASLSLAFYPEHLKLVVSDDGIGFVIPNQRSGLQNVMERAESISADIEIQSFKNKGTTVTLTVPHHNSKL